MSGEIHREIENNVATLTIDNQQKRNALGPPLIGDIVDELDELEDHDDVRCIVLTGAGEKAFSSGFDISFHERNLEEKPDEEESTIGDIVDRIKHYDYPVIAMLNGGTFGGSMYLIASCDMRIAVDDAQFGITPAKLGMVYGGDAIGEIMAHTGPSGVKEMLFTGEFIDAQRAYDMGFLNDVVPREELEDRTYEMAETIASNAPLSLMGMKRIIRAIQEKTTLTDAERELSERIEAEAKDSYDHEEGVKAFMNNRTPEFEGR